MSDPQSSVRSLEGLAELKALGRRLGQRLHAGDTVGLVGDLGSGKTTLARAIVAGAGLDPALVSSPTFTLIHTYRGSGREIHHADLYRLESREALEATGYFDLLEGEGPLIVEWIDRLPAAAPRQWLRVELRFGSRAEGREAILTAIGEGGRRLLSGL